VLFFSTLKRSTRERQVSEMTTEVYDRMPGADSWIVSDSAVRCGSMTFYPREKCPEGIRVGIHWERPNYRVTIFVADDAKRTKERNELAELRIREMVKSRGVEAPLIIEFVSKPEEL
jgi:hypothetical protein